MVPSPTTHDLGLYLVYTIQQTSSKCRAISTCILNTFAGRLLDRMNEILPFSHNTSVTVGRTDRQTDRQTDGDSHGSIVNAVGKKVTRVITSSVLQHVLKMSSSTRMQAVESGCCLPKLSKLAYVS